MEKAKEKEMPVQGKMQIIYGQRPPNFDMIVEAFPMAANENVVFAYGDEIYVPSGRELEYPLKVHEAVHGQRQKELGLDDWWRRYIEDDAFRYYEELLAHTAEYTAMVQQSENKTRQYRRKCLDFVAKKLAAPLYKCKGGFANAKRDIKKMELDYREAKKNGLQPNFN